MQTQYAGGLAVEASGDFCQGRMGLTVDGNHPMPAKNACMPICIKRDVNTLALITAQRTLDLESSAYKSISHMYT